MRWQVVVTNFRTTVTLAENQNSHLTLSTIFFCMRYLLLHTTILFLLSCSNKTKKNTGDYRAGFKTIRTVDTSRIYKPDTDTSDYWHYRSLDLDIWYPAHDSPTDSVLLFQDFLGLLEERANYYTASTAATGLTKQVAQSFCEGFKCSDPDKLLKYKTSSYKNAISADQKFPLVVYLSSFNSMCYENFALFEKLANKGYVVLSINSIGGYPGDMTMKNGDMMEQVFDAVSSLKFLEKGDNIDFSKIGIIGYSWGGFSGTVLASKISNTGCLISFDGSEFHHYGQNTDEDADFDGIRNSDDFRKMSLTVPYLRLESSPVAAPAGNKNVYNFSEKLASEKLILEVDSTEHQDFCSLPFIVRASGNCKNTQTYNNIANLTISFLDDHLKKSNSFSHALEREIDKTVRQKNELA